MLLCPNCTSELKKNPKHAEGVWSCSEEVCGKIWMLMELPTPKYLRKGKRKVKETPKEPDSFTKEDVKEVVKMRRVRDEE